MMIHVTQCLCPNRHCIMAIAWEDPKFTAEAARTNLREIVENSIGRGLNPWCGICGSRDLRYEDGVTRFKTMEEAMPILRRNEEQQLQTRNILGRF